MGIRLSRIAWKGVDGQMTGTVVSHDWQGPPGAEFVKVWADGGRTVLTVYIRDMIKLSDKRDFAFGNKPPSSQDIIRNLHL